MSLNTQTSLTKVGLVGAPGRMSLRLVQALSQTSLPLVCSAALARPLHASIGQNIGMLAQQSNTPIPIEPFSEQAFSKADVWIEFAHPHVSVQTAQACATYQKPVVIATTGHNDHQRKQIAEAAQHTPILMAPNTSLGVFVLQQAVALAARALGSEYDIEMMEIHHRQKKDAPSGTALQLAHCIAELGAHPADNWVHARTGNQAIKQSSDIGVAALRGGQVVGEHTVYFLGPHDRLEFTHRAQDRHLFAAGALVLAHRLIKKTPGLYTITDVY